MAFSITSRVASRVILGVGMSLGLGACAVPAPAVIRTTAVKDFIAQVKCEIAAGVHAVEPATYRTRVKGWVAKSVLQIKGDDAAAVGGQFGYTPLSPAPSLSLGFARGEGLSETKDITFVDSLDTMGRPRCANGGIDPEPGNNLGLAAWVQESLSAFGPDNRTQFRQLGRTIVFTASAAVNGKISFAVAPASADLTAERKRSDTHTLTIAMAEQEQAQTYRVLIVGSSGVSTPLTKPNVAPRANAPSGPESRAVPSLAPTSRPITDFTIQNLNRTIDRLLPR